MALLFLADAIFIILHLLHAFSGLSGFRSPLLSIRTDGGYAEIYQYIKELWIVALLVFVARRRSNLLFLCWSFLFLYLLLDDSLGIHENLGAFIASWTGIQGGFGLRPEDFGELGISLFFGALIIASISLMHYLSEPVDRQISSLLFGLFALLVFFGVFLDMVDIIVYNSAGISIFDTIEDAGEMLVMSLTVWFTYSINSPPRQNWFHGRANDVAGVTGRVDHGRDRK